MSNLKSQFATSSSAASYILKLEIPNRNTKFYVRLLFAFTVYHTFFYEDSHNLAIFAEKEDKTICLSELPYPLFPYIFFANVFSNAAISGLASSFRSISWSVCDAVSDFVSSCTSSAAGAALIIAVDTLQLLIHKDISTIILNAPFGNINAVPSQTEHLAHTQGTGKSKV